MKSQGIPPVAPSTRSKKEPAFDVRDVVARCRENPRRNFTPGDCTRAGVSRMAAGICALNAAGPICLCSNDKALIASALFAAVHGGPRLVLPYGFSRQALQETHECIPFSCILGDTAGEPLPGIPTITRPMIRGTDFLPEKYVSPDEPIVRLFTGGSTGKPKLWSKTPANLLGEAFFLIGRFGITTDDIILSTVPPQHVYGLLFSVLVPLVAGCSVLAPVYTFPQEITDALREQAASILVSVPVHYHVLQGNSLQRYSLRTAFSSAGALHPQDAAFFHDATGLAVTEIFGSTETGGIAWRHNPSQAPSWEPFEDVQWEIEKQRLLVRSDFLSPELPRDRQGFFATADRAEPCGASSFTLHGRADDVVKVGGKRVDLAEVCSKIKLLDGVADAVVFALHTRKGRGSEIAALVAGSIDAARLRLLLSEICEPYATPRHIRVAASIPVLASGKYDREEIEKVFKTGIQKPEASSQ